MYIYIFGTIVTLLALDSVISWSLMMRRTDVISRTLVVVVVAVLLFYVHGKHLMSCRDGQLT